MRPSDSCERADPLVSCERADPLRIRRENESEASSLSLAGGRVNESEPSEPCPNRRVHESGDPSDLRPAVLISEDSRRLWIAALAGCSSISAEQGEEEAAGIAP